MPLTSTFLGRFRTFFNSLDWRLAIVIFVLFGWIVAFVVLFVTLIADAVARFGPGKRLPPVPRIAIGVTAFVAVGLLGGAGRSPTISGLAQSPAPTMLATAAIPSSQGTVAATLANPPAAPTEEPTPEPVVAFGSRAPIVEFFEALGFDGGESPLTDGTPRWLARRDSDSATAEVIGPASAVTQIGMVLGATPSGGEDAGADLGLVLGIYAPGSTDWVVDVLTGVPTSGDVDVSRRFGDRTVQVQTLTASDGVLIVVTIEHD